MPLPVHLVHEVPEDPYFVGGGPSVVAVYASAHAVVLARAGVAAETVARVQSSSQDGAEACAHSRLGNTHLGLIDVNFCNENSTWSSHIYSYPLPPPHPHALTHTRTHARTHARMHARTHAPTNQPTR